MLTHSEGSQARIASLGGLAGGSWGSLVLGIGALAGGGLGGLRHGEGLQESLWKMMADKVGVYRNRGVNKSDRIRGMSERCLREVFTVCEGALHYVWICIEAQMCCLCGRLIRDVDLVFGPFPQGVDDFCGSGGQGAGPGSACMRVSCCACLCPCVLTCVTACSGVWGRLARAGPSTARPELLYSGKG